jgi:hypothetical protein
MPNKYFKPRRPFNLHPHKYDLGIFTGLKQGNEDNHFLARLWKLAEEEYRPYYQYHLAYFLNKELQGERGFFTYVWRITLIRIQYLENENPFSSNHAKHTERLYTLLNFQKFLRSIDQWNTDRTQAEIIAAQADEIKTQGMQIADLKEQLKSAKKLETEAFIDIEKGHGLTVCDVFLQLQDALLPNGKKLLFPADQIIYRRMICKYFRDGGKEINFESIHRYFPSNKKNPGRKYAPIPLDNKLFKVVPAPKRS